MRVEAQLITPPGVVSHAKPLSQTPTVSTDSALVSSKNCSFLTTLKETLGDIKEILFRFFTSLFNREKPSFSDFRVPDMTTERFQECRDLIVKIEGQEWSRMNPWRSNGPSQRQKATLVHVIGAFIDYLAEQSKKPNGNTKGRLAVLLPELPTWAKEILIEPEKGLEHYAKMILNFVSDGAKENPSNQETNVSLNFRASTLVDMGKGPIYLHQEFLVRKVTFHVGNRNQDVTTNDLFQCSKTPRFFNPKSAAQAHRELLLK